MRSIAALTISLIFHGSVIWLWPHHVEIAEEFKKNSALWIRIGTQNIKNQALVNDRPENNKPPIESVKKSLSGEGITSSEPKSHYDLTTEYWGTNQLDRRALPIGNITAGMLSETYQSLAVIRLRLYIDSTGKVVKIVKDDNQDDETLIGDELESLLYQMTFIPARKNSEDVNSYQDIEFSFN